MMKKISKISFALGAVALLVGALLAFSSSKLSAVSALGSFFVSLGLSTLTVSLVEIIFDKKLSEAITPKTTALSLSVSATVALGIHCVMSFLSCFFLTDPSKHPIRFPASFAVGVVCFAVFCVLLSFYIKIRHENASAKGVIFETASAVIFLPTFFLGYNFADKIISNLI